jgi:hypothetical protein
MRSLTNQPRVLRPLAPRLPAGFNIVVRYFVARTVRGVGILLPGIGAAVVTALLALIFAPGDAAFVAMSPVSPGHLSALTCRTLGSSSRALSAWLEGKIRHLNPTCLRRWSRRPSSGRWCAEAASRCSFSKICLPPRDDDQFLAIFGRRTVEIAVFRFDHEAAQFEQMA